MRDIRHCSNYQLSTVIRRIIYSEYICKLICKYKSRNARGGTRAEFYTRKDSRYSILSASSPSFNSLKFFSSPYRFSTSQNITFAFPCTYNFTSHKNYIWIRRYKMPTQSQKNNGSTHITFLISKSVWRVDIKGYFCPVWRYCVLRSAKFFNWIAVHTSKLEK